MWDLDDLDALDDLDQVISKHFHALYNLLARS